MAKKAPGVIIALAVFLLCPILAAADISIGLATPSKDNITISKFPFHYNDVFRVYNNANEDRIYTIDVVAPYTDVLDWVNVNSSIFVLGPGSSTQIRFTIDADDGYTGNYTIMFRPAAIPEYTPQNASQIMAYAKLSSLFSFRIEVPDAVGEGSLGRRPFLEDKTPKQKQENITKIISDTTKDSAGVEFAPLSRPVVLTIPDTVQVNELTKIALSSIGGNTPVDLKFLIISPSGERFTQPAVTQFSFNDVGKWSVLATIGDKIIFGKVVEVKPKQEVGSRNLIIAAEVVAIAVLLAAILLVRRRKHHHDAS